MTKRAPAGAKARAAARGPRTTKVAINRCWGGFGISNDALLALIAMKSKSVTAEPISGYSGPEWLEQTRKEYSIPFKAGFTKHEYIDGVLVKDDIVYHIENDNDPEFRAHPDLISVIERMGAKRASSHLAELVIVEIPSNVEFKIDDYDGMEKVCEAHREW